MCAYLKEMIVLETLKIIEKENHLAKINETNSYVCPLFVLYSNPQKNFILITEVVTTKITEISEIFFKCRTKLCLKCTDVVKRAN